jgi:hypothetical protein
MAITLQNLNKKVFLITYDALKKTEWFKKFKKEFKGKLILLKSHKLNENFFIFIIS